MTDEVFDGLTAEDVAKATNGYETLGPGYFAARRIAERLMAGTEAEPLKKLTAKVVDDIQTQVYEYVEWQMRGDLEHNLQGHLARLLDDTVQALLTGQQWALDRYPLARYHDGETIRKAIAKHCGETVMTMRVAELEKECQRLRESLDVANGRYR